VDEKVKDLVNVLHKQNVLDETIKLKKDIPQPVHIVQTEPAKKGADHQRKQTHFQSSIYLVKEKILKRQKQNF